ncbi:MAG: UDP-N-acetylmuramate dehydrogenase [Desulfobacteraceae bacterium]|nr:UDP-N-acetylmuramate dehydrogenase [Desulfobacteraceae bacterium]
MARLQVAENQPLAPLTTFRLGGPARYYAAVDSEAAMLQALDFAKSRDVPVFVLGGGCNVLFSDEGFEGLIIHDRICGITSRPEGDHLFVRAGAGEDWQDFVDWCVSRGLQGIECLAGIPGTVGASPVQNIGAYGQEVSESIAEVRAMEMHSGKPVVFGNDSCGFGYRTSIFNTVAAGKYFITGVSFRLKRDGKPKISHKDFRDLPGAAPDAALAQVRDITLAIRAGKGLLARKGHECFRCAGSFFKNPVVPAEKFRKVEERMQTAGRGSGWFWSLSTGEVKLSAACLIQEAGFGRGYRRGNVGLSPKHTLIIIAHDRAASQEVVQFAEEIRGTVNEKFGILLRPEVRLVGFPPSCLV